MAFFRRFLILFFNVIIPENERNPNLAKEIIAEELSGIFNWVVDGLRRLLEQNGFSKCEAAEEMLATFRRESDTVAMFLSDESYFPSEIPVNGKYLFQKYRSYCLQNGYKFLGRNKFNKRLEANKVILGDGNAGIVAYMGNKKMLFRNVTNVTFVTAHLFLATKVTFVTFV
jgi:putative DNA primase/helicase